tara:strand:- start:1635 stop:1961 length:327 start_codon:yes stop_codon:yes gene_type:complete
MYRPDELDQRIEFFAETRTSDGMGGSSVSWVSKGSSWAKAKPLSGKEVERYDQLEASNNYKFVVRNRQDLTESDKITWNGTDYNIRSIPDLGKRVLYLEILAERGVAQ